MLTLEEAILYAEEVAEENEKNAQFYEYRFSYRKVEYYQKKADECLRCASEHRQLAEWLKELKAYRESWEELFSTVYEIKANSESEDIQNIAKFLVNYMLILEKRIKEVNADEDSD